MRKILMSEKGEFDKQRNFDYIKSAAMKLLASNIGTDKEADDEVTILRKLPREADPQSSF